MSVIPLIEDDYKIPAGLHLYPMRESIECWDTLKTDWSIIYGTGEYKNITIGDYEYHVYDTTSLPCDVNKSAALFSTGDPENPIAWLTAPVLWNPNAANARSFIFVKFLATNESTFNSYKELYGTIYKKVDGEYIATEWNSGISTYYY